MFALLLSLAACSQQPALRQIEPPNTTPYLRWHGRQDEPITPHIARPRGWPVNEGYPPRDWGSDAVLDFLEAVLSGDEKVQPIPPETPRPPVARLTPRSTTITRKDH
jgi:hypothetical protein